MDGIVIVDKPENITSYDVIRRLKKIFTTKKIGHGGTLDPFASGVLVTAVNKATKIISFFLDSDKEYIAKLKLGEMTDTFDLTGKIVDKADAASVTREDLALALKDFTGEIEQTPPMYSAKKMNGVKLYELARKGVEVERKKVAISIKDLEIIEYSPPYAVIRVACSKGTYIRSLANDIGLKLGCFAHLVELKRTKSGSVGLEAAHSLKELELAMEEGRLDDLVISMNDALSFLPAVQVKSDAEKKVRHGVYLRNGDVKSLIDGETMRSPIRLLSENGELLAIADYDVKDVDDNEKNGEFKYKRVFINN